MEKNKLKLLHMDRPDLGTATLALPQLPVLHTEACLLKLDLTLRPRVVSAKKQTHSKFYYIFVIKKREKKWTFMISATRILLNSFFPA